MDDSKLLLSLFFCVVVVSGCITTNDASTTVEGQDSIEINELTVTPTTVYEDSSTRATLEFVNAGRLEGDIDIGENGRNILTNYCPDIFQLDEPEFDTTASSTVEQDGNMFTLGEGNRLELRWRLNQEGSVPLYTLECTLDFELPFEYSVSSYRQIQIMEDYDVEGADQLDSESTSGPLILDIQTIPGEVGDHSSFTTEDETLTFHLQLVNAEQESGAKGLVDVDEDSIEIDVSGPVSLDMEEDCDIPEGELEMYEGRSALISCDASIDGDLNSQSQISNIEASLDYSYIKDAGSRTVEVERRG